MITWVDDSASLEAMVAAMAAADVVGVDTEWMDGPTGRRGASDAVLATVQVRTNPNPNPNPDPDPDPNPP